MIYNRLFKLDIESRVVFRRYLHFKDFIYTPGEGYGLKSVGAGTGEMDYTNILRFLKKEKPFIYATLENTSPENAAWCVENLKKQYDQLEV